MRCVLSVCFGIPRFSQRSAWGYDFSPVVLGTIYCNTQIREVRDDESRTFAALEQAQAARERARPREGVEPTPESKTEGERAEAEVRTLDADYQKAKGIRDHWKSLASGGAIALAVMLLIDAALLPGLVRRRRALELAEPSLEVVHPDAVAGVHEGGVGEDPTLAVHSKVTDIID